MINNQVQEVSGNIKDVKRRMQINETVFHVPTKQFITRVTKTEYLYKELIPEAGVVKSVTAGQNIYVDNTDPKNPIVSFPGVSGFPNYDGVSDRRAVDLAFEDAGNSLPLTTATQIDGVTVTDAMRVVVFDSATASEDYKIYSASVSGSDIVWTVEQDGTGNDLPSEGHTVWVKQGTAYADTRWTFNGSVWTQTGGGQAVSGPASSTDNAIARFDGTTGKKIQDSLATVDDTGSVNIPTGEAYQINKVDILTATALDPSVIAAPGLETVGILTTGNATAIVDQATTELAGKSAFAIPIEAEARTSTILATTPASLVNFALKSEVDAKIDENLAGLAWKDDVAAATTTEINIANDLNVGDIIDGYTLALDDRVLVKDQTTNPEENGIYVADAIPVRSDDMNASLEFNGAVVPVLNGASNAGTHWRCSTVDPVVDTDPINFVSLTIAVPDASTTVKGISELATQAETEARIDTVRTVTPSGLTDFVVSTPGTSTDNAITRYDGISADVQDSLVTIDDNGSVNIPTGQAYEINSVDILTASTLNVSVTSALGLTSVGTLTTGNATAIVDQATTTLAGKTEYAEVAEADARTSTVLATTPASLVNFALKSEIVTLGVFTESAGVIQQGNTPAYDEDFVFGSTQLADTGNALHDKRLSFDKSKGSFRVGEATGTEWDDSNVGIDSIVYGGLDNIASGDYSSASGKQAKAYLLGQKSHSAGRFAITGDAQKSTLILRADTTNATPEVMYIDNNSANKLILPASTTWNFKGLLTASTLNANSTACFSIEGCIRRDNANNTTMVYSTVLTKADDITLTAAIPVAITANDTNEDLEIKIIGNLATNLSWVCYLDILELGY